jgi:hypothetical protein
LSLIVFCSIDSRGEVTRGEKSLGGENLLRTSRTGTDDEGDGAGEDEDAALSVGSAAAAAAGATVLLKTVEFLLGNLSFASLNDFLLAVPSLVVRATVGGGKTKFSAWTICTPLLRRKSDSLGEPPVGDLGESDSSVGGGICDNRDAGIANCDCVRSRGETESSNLALPLFAL